MIEIQKLEQLDTVIPVVAGWLYTEWGQYLPNRSLETSVAGLKTQPSTNGLPMTLVAMKGGEPVGVARLVEADLDSRPDLSPWLASVYVPTEHRNQGIGNTLCKSVVKEAEQLGFEESFYSPQTE